MTCRYELYHVTAESDDDDEPVLTLFGQVSTPFWSALFTWKYPVLDAQGTELTCVHRVFGSGMQVRSRLRRSPPKTIQIVMGLLHMHCSAQRSASSN